ncbi:helix-turn-helix transcriptional regulator [Agrobacterium genomosp. 3]|uniref:helix-turn-helix domain-containing protein n=1 Tax=Agrobacterium tomkonis TaxID=1183410 RepID=UPI0032DB6C5E|nr:helix-turn-helix transcriptional regulator [Agrobacterium tomkonis]MCA1895311.1 helix-turn-helix transcriptional regulator [Agrobacterium tomkonis]
MYAPAATSLSRDELVTLRRECGNWLKEKREAAGLSQRGLAQKVGIEFYTFISQIESGRGRVPPERFEAYAKGLNLDPKEFAMTMMRYNEPVVFALLFPEEEKTVVQAPKVVSEQPTVTDLEKRIAQLERLLLKD